MGQRHFIQRIDYTITVNIFVFDIAWHNRTEGLLGTVFNVVFVLSLSYGLIAIVVVIQTAILFLVRLFHLILFSILHDVFRISEITPYRKTEVSRYLHIVADISIRSRAFQPTDIGIGIGHNSHIFGNLYTLLEDTITLILKEINDKIYFIIEEFPLNPQIRLDRSFPS